MVSYVIAILLVQGVYYYFYQIFRNKAEAAALERRKIGVGDGSVGMLSSLVVAALSGYFLMHVIMALRHSLFHNIFKAINHHLLK